MSPINQKEHPDYTARHDVAAVERMMPVPAFAQPTKAERETLQSGGPLRWWVTAKSGAGKTTSVKLMNWLFNGHPDFRALDCDAFSFRNAENAWVVDYELASIIASMHVPVMIFFGGNKHDVGFRVSAGITRHFHVLVSESLSMSRRQWREQLTGHPIVGRYTKSEAPLNAATVRSLPLLTEGLVAMALAHVPFTAPASRLRRFCAVVDTLQHQLTLTDAASRSSQKETHHEDIGT